MEEYLRYYGIRICPGHGLYYKLGSEYRILVSSEESEAVMGQKVKANIRNKRLKSGLERRSPSYTAKEIGKSAKLLVNGSISSRSGPSFCCSVPNETELLYLCGCENTQPMRSDNFREHMRAEGNKSKCKLSVWGKSKLEALVIEATAFGFCGVRCSRATCGQWVVRSYVEPDVAKLSIYLQKLKALEGPKGIQKSEPGIASPYASALAIAGDLETNAEETENNIGPTSIIADIQTSKPVILLLGFTFRKESDKNGPSYAELLEEARCYYGKEKAQLPGAIRDKARIVRLRDAGFDCFCVSKSNEDENEESKHYCGDFCDRKFVQVLREKLHKRPVQVCVDWIWCPMGWDTTHYLKPQFFTKTLPKIAPLLNSEAIDLDSADVTPSAVIFLPFTLGVMVELFKTLNVIESKYTVSYLDREQLMVQHPMFAATASIPDNEMELLNKKPRPEDEYAEALFKNIDAGASSDIDSRQFKSYVLSNCSRQTRMIKLTLKDCS